jgi:integrase
MASTWTKLSGSPKDKGLYRSANGTVRVKYMVAETVNGKRVLVQRATSFPKNDVYRITLEDGTSKRVSVETYARDFKQRMDRERRAGRLRDPEREDVSLADYWRLWSTRPSGRTGEARRPSTVARNTYAWAHIEPTLGDLPVRSITVSMVRDWDARLTCGQGARNKAVRLLSSLLAAAANEGLRVGNPVSGLKAQDRVRAVERHEVFDDEQLARLRAAIEPRYALLVDMLSYGLRLGEALALRRSDVNLKGDVTIQRTVVDLNGTMHYGPPKSHNGNRTLPLGHLREVMQHHMASCSQPEPDGLLFTAPEGGPVRPGLWRQRAFYPALAAAGLPRIVPHALRHAVVTRLADKGFSDTQIASFIGDTAAVVARTYRNVLVSTNEDIAAALAQEREGVQ